MIERRIRKPMGLLNMFSLARLLPGRRCRHYLSQFERDDSLGAHLDLLFTVKHNKQVALNRIIRQRLKKKGTSAKVLGGKTERSYRDGLLVHVDGQGEMSSFNLKEPFGIDIYESSIAIASGDSIRVYDLESEQTTVYRFEWFAQLHSVSFSEDGERLLVAATGYDTALEYSLERAELTWFWNGWDHEFERSPSGVRFRRTKDGIEHFNPDKNCFEPWAQSSTGFGLPTGLTTTHLNNVQYFNQDKICITLFHQGKAVILDRRDGSITEVLGGLLNPHGFEPAWDDEKVVTDTRRGRTIFFDKDFLVKRTLIFDLDPPVPGREELGEWLQNVLPLTDHLYGAIDIHRSCIWIINMDSKKYRKIEVSRDWAVQNVIVANKSLLDGLNIPLSDFPSVDRQVSDPDEIARYIE